MGHGRRGQHARAHPLRRRPQRHARRQLDRPVELTLGALVAKDVVTALQRHLARRDDRLRRPADDRRGRLHRAHELRRSAPPNAEITAAGADDRSLPRRRHRHAGRRTRTPSSASRGRSARATSPTWRPTPPTATTTIYSARIKPMQLCYERPVRATAGRHAAAADAAARDSAGADTVGRAGDAGGQGLALGHRLEPAHAHHAPPGPLERRRAAVRVPRARARRAPARRQGPGDRQRARRPPRSTARCSSRCSSRRPAASCSSARRSSR